MMSHVIDDTPGIRAAAAAAATGSHREAKRDINRENVFLRI